MLIYTLAVSLVSKLYEQATTKTTRKVNL